MTDGRTVLRVVEDDLAGADVVALLSDHLSAMLQHSPAGSVHALDLSGLRAPGVTLWCARMDGELAGCAALAELDATRGELKSFRTHPAYLRRGVASALLAHLLDVARSRGYGWVGLETGSGTAFEAAHALYRRHGFTARGPFGDYPDDPFSRFFEIIL